MTRWLLSAVLVLFALDASAAYRIDHLEPASWWVGMKDPHLQLLVHGARISELEPSLDFPGVILKGTSRTGNPNYLFIDLEIAPGTRAGRFRIDFRRNGKAEAGFDYTLNERESGSSARRGFGPSDVIYLVTPDRFANGDAANDTLARFDDGLNRIDPNGRHGGDLQGLRERLDYIARMGFTQVWLNPILENNQPDTSYHGYAVTDFYRVDARFGDNELFRTLAREARAKGIGMIMDVILNHCGSAHWWMKDLPGKEWINNGGRFVANNHDHEAPHDPHGAAGDRRRLVEGWFVPTMPDLNQRNPQLATYLVQNTIWWVEYAGLSGLRIDTWPYSDRDFLAAWTRRVLDEYPGLNIVGEEWSLNPSLVAHWQRGSRWRDGYESFLPSLFDFPLQDALIRGLLDEEGKGRGLWRIYSVLANDFVYPDPYNLVVFPENHDMNRLFTQLDERIDLYRMAIVFVATTRGIPQFYYGSELLKTSPRERHDGMLRSDFPGGWPDDEIDGFTGTGLTQPEKGAQEFLRALLNWRKGATAVHGGQLTQYAPENGVYVYFRDDGRQKVMVAINKAGEDRTLDISRFSETIGPSLQATDAMTRREFRLDAGLKVGARSATIFELRDPNSPATAVSSSGALLGPRPTDKQDLTPPGSASAETRGASASSAPRGR